MSIELEFRKRALFDTSKFTKEFPSGQIKSADFRDIPEKAAVLFDTRVSMRTHKHEAGAFNSVFKIDHQEGGQTYVAQKRIINDNGSAVDWTYLFDTDLHGRPQGYGEIVHGNSDKPFVGYTFSEIKKQGLGQRRLKMMNAISTMLYDKPLHSASTISDSARGVWEKLVHEGVAERYMDEETQRYVFL